MDKIDFVIPWVDGNDPEWRKLKDRYSDNVTEGNEEERFREWDQLRYWFRGVEKHAPWVNRIHFVTCGHLPPWLNVDHPKLHIVRHEDYIPKEWLPTFSSHTIELNMHRIEGLSEQFVYFNDDFFIIDDVKPTDFFVDGLPCSTAGLRVLQLGNPQFSSIIRNGYALINRHFEPRETLKKHWSKFIHPKYELKRNVRTISLLPKCRDAFPGFYDVHGPNAYLKSTLETVWKEEPELLSRTSSHKFRTTEDVNQYIFEWWQWCEGKVHPINCKKLFTYMATKMPNEQLLDVLLNKKTPVVAVNDGKMPDDFEQKKEVINGAFDRILGEKSSYER